MHKETITYTDFNGLERTEDFYFNLTRSEVAEMELGVVGGLSEAMKKMAQKLDVPSIIRVIKEFILRSYGEKTADGKGFKKSEEISDAFYHTNAYDVLFMRLAENPSDELPEFINSIFPNHN